MSFYTGNFLLFSLFITSLFVVVINNVAVKGTYWLVNANISKSNLNLININLNNLN